MLATTNRVAEVAGIGLEPDDVGLELRSARLADTLSSLRVAPSTTPDRLSPCRAWKRLTAASTKESYTGPEPASGSRSPDTTSRSRSAWTRGPLEPIRSSAPAGTVFQPPRATMSWYFWIAACGGLDRRRRQDRRRLARHRHFRRRLVALRPFGLARPFLGPRRERARLISASAPTAVERTKRREDRETLVSRIGSNS